jgi:hypothetical protein
VLKDELRSILFLPNQIEAMKAGLQAYESQYTGKEPLPVVAATDSAVVTPPPEVINEPAAYPAFFLSSIVYRNSADWSVWMGGEKITPHRNDTDVSVVSIAPDQVTFAWSPTYKAAINKRYSTHLFAATDTVKNKLAKEQRSHFDQATGRLTFTLKQNQTFVVGYFKTFEGFVAAPALAPLAPAAAPLQAGAAASVADVENNPGIFSLPSPSTPPVHP